MSPADKTQTEENELTDVEDMDIPTFLKRGAPGVMGRDADAARLGIESMSNPTPYSLRLSVTQQFDEIQYLIDLLTQVAPGAAFADLEHMRLVAPVQRKLMDVQTGLCGEFEVRLSADNLGVLQAYVKGGRHARNDPYILDLCERILALN